MPYGLSNAGFGAKTTQEVLADIEASELLLIDAALDLSPTEPIGQANGIFAAATAELWELISTIYGMFDPNKAEGALLDTLCSITGTSRKAATYSYVDCNVVTNGAVNALAGALVVAVAGQADVRFANSLPITHASAGTYVVRMVAQQTGAVAAASGTLTQIIAPVLNVQTVTNPLAATLGTLIETDAALRLRRIQELNAVGSGTVGSITTDVSKVPGVLSVHVFENTGDVVDVNGLPPHSFETLIDDGFPSTSSNNAVAQAIWNDKPSGIATYGSQIAAATDSHGDAQPVFFTRVSRLDLSLAVRVETTPLFPIDGPAKIAAAVAAKSLAIQFASKDAIPIDYKVAVMEACPGIRNITAFALYDRAVNPGVPPAATDFTNDVSIVVPLRSRAVLDASFVTVTSFPATSV